MTKTQLVTDAQIDDVQVQLDALLVRINGVKTLLQSTEASIRVSLDEAIETAQRRIDSESNDLIAAIEDAVQDAKDRLELIYNDPEEDVSILETIVDGNRRYYCCPANQAKSYKKHIAQKHQFAHRGMLLVDRPFYRFYSSASKPRPQF